MKALLHRLRSLPPPLRCFLAQGATMLAVSFNVNQIVASRPITVMIVQGIIGLAWVVNVNAVANGNALTRAAYILGGCVGAGLGTILGASR